MSRFSYTRPETVEAAVVAVDDRHPAMAGGTDLLPRIKLGLATPVELVDIKRSGLSSAIGIEHDRIVFGALTTLASIEHHRSVAERLPALVEAAREAATPQIRNRATLAGNLLQRPRCWYFRDPTIDCWLKGGTACPARDGRNEHHAIFDESPCVAVHPSDLAACLVALDASITVVADDGTRAVSITDLFHAPDDSSRVETTIGPGELISSIEVPDRGFRSTYRKAMDRAAWAFALVGVAVALRIEDGRCNEARIVLSGVANTPHRARTAEAALVGQRLDATCIDAAADAVTDGARPLRENGYKRRLAAALTRDALSDLARRPR